MKAILWPSLIVLMGISPSLLARERETNICDILEEKIRTGTTKKTVENLRVCWKEFGKSDYRLYLEKMIDDQKEKADTIDRDAKKLYKERQKAREAKVIKEFTLDDIVYHEHNFSELPIVGLKTTYNQYGDSQDMWVTKPDVACQYLGFDKAIRHRLGALIDDYKVDFKYNGLAIDSAWFFSRNKTSEPDTFKFKNGMDGEAIRIFEYLQCERKRQSGEPIQKSKIRMEDIEREVSQKVGKVEVELQRVDIDQAPRYSRASYGSQGVDNPNSSEATPDDFFLYGADRSK